MRSRPWRVACGGALDNVACMNRLLDPNSPEKNDRFTLLAPSKFPDTYYDDADPMPHKGRRAPRASGPMDDLAPETLARVFALLDPKTLGVCAGVCRTWHAILQLDTTWRTAFAVAFGLDEREESIAARVLAGDTACTSLRVAPALRRLDASSWKAEYTARVALLRYVYAADPDAGASHAHRPFSRIPASRRSMRWHCPRRAALFFRCRTASASHRARMHSRARSPRTFWTRLDSRRWGQTASPTSSSRR